MKRYIKCSDTKKKSIKAREKSEKDWDLNDYAYNTYGIFVDDLTDEDYDALYEEYNSWLADKDFSERWDSKLVEPATEVFDTDDSLDWLEDVDKFLSKRRF